VTWDATGTPGTTDHKGNIAVRPAPDSPSGNKVTVTADVPGDVYGGIDVATGDGDTASSNNEVTVSGSMVERQVYGGYGYAGGNGQAASNGSAVMVSSSNVKGLVYGGYGYVGGNGQAASNGNAVTVSSSNVDWEVKGGYGYVGGSGQAASNGNAVIVSSSSVNWSVYGGYSIVLENGTAISSGNNVIFCVSNVSKDLYGGVTNINGGNSVSSGNNVVVSGSNVGGRAYGGYANVHDGQAISSGNNVAVSGSDVSRDVIGGYASVYYGQAVSSGNYVAVSGSKVGGSAYGGYALAYIFGDGQAISSGNNVAVSDSDVSGDVIGGYAFAYDGQAAALHNQVTLEGNTHIGGNVAGGGGEVRGTGPSQFFVGNALNVRNPQSGGIAVDGDVSGFEFFAFLYQADAVNGAVGLNVDGKAYLNDQNAAGTGFKPSGVRSIDIMGGGRALPIGHALVLISAGILESAAFSQTRAQGRQGATLLYDYYLDISSGTELIATVAGLKINPQSKALSEGVLAGSALVNQGTDLLAGYGIENAVRAARSANSGSLGPSAFAGIMGGRTRLDTGSHVKATGFSLLSGLSLGQRLSPGRLTLGAFLEFGSGQYDTYNSLANAATVRGGGRAKYLGGGLLGRLDFNEFETGQLYAEASVRFGQAENRFNSFDILGNMGQAAAYESTRNYWGLHAGLGYILDIGEYTSVDLYAKYFWTGQRGDSIALSTGDPVTFEKVNSHRVRLGARLSAKVNGYIEPYLGLAWEGEFDGKARASAYGLPIDVPSMKGSTGIGQAGLSIRPSADSPVSVEIGLQGYAGKRQGATGFVNMRLEF
jgi:hypothetical protein